MIVHSFPTFQLNKVLYVAEALGFDYQLNLMQATSGEHRQAEHRARHPLGKVPVLELDGHCYFESNSICRLLCELADNKLYGATPTERAEVNQWVDLISFAIGPHLQVFVWEDLIKKYVRQDPNPDLAQLDAANEAMAAPFETLDARLSEHRFLCGDRLSFADYIAFAWLEITTFTSAEFTSHTSIQRWFAEIGQLPAIAQGKARVPNGAIFEFLAN
jgi:glutathione S-transferase